MCAIWVRVGFLFFVLIGFCGCFTLTVSAPAAHVESSESFNDSSSLKSFIGASYEQSAEFTLFDSPSVRPLQSSPARLETDGGLFGSAVLSAYNLDLRLSVAPPLIGTDGSYSYGIRPLLKWQFLGETRSHSQNLGWRAAVYGGITQSREHSAGDQQELFGESGSSWSGNSSFDAYEGGLSFGYRVSPQLLLNLGEAYQSFSVSARVHQDPTSDDAGGDWTASPRPGFDTNSCFSATYNPNLDSHLTLGVSQTRWKWNEIDRSAVLLFVDLTISSDTLWGRAVSMPQNQP